ncbi:hypothetical protein N7520_000580 [Penicillium odoratum]|uniref:uncharacterized protein n=1 Tax=Penicillium odoratum TaxID=1167516 RepID=UPI002547C7AE|nr:uncharacterized protein N7520_000580 [Penicillium odoratum]KAJ5777334.1 hypothetical protein N7520_000580 [Penicillium odoratum]
MYAVQNGNNELALRFMEIPGLTAADSQPYRLHTRLRQMALSHREYATLGLWKKTEGDSAGPDSGNDWLPRARCSHQCRAGP